MIDSSPLDGALEAELGAVARRHPGLRLFILYGSRARGDHHAGSDWDFGYLGDVAVDPLDLLADLVTLLRTERIDVANLDRAGALLRFTAARDGIPLFVKYETAFEDFWLKAVSFWCEIEPIVTPIFEEQLRELAR